MIIFQQSVSTLTHRHTYFPGLKGERSNEDYEKSVIERINLRSLQHR